MLCCYGESPRWSKEHSSFAIFPYLYGLVEKVVDPKCELQGFAQLPVGEQVHCPRSIERALVEIILKDGAEAPGEQASLQCWMC